jgi:preprotein translocase subunit SecE
VAPLAPETGIKMAKSATMERAAETGLARLKAWPQRVKSFYNDVRTEMKKVTTPSRKEVQGTTTVVIITVALFAIYFQIIDSILNLSLGRLLKALAHR